MTAPGRLVLDTAPGGMFSPVRRSRVETGSTPGKPEQAPGKVKWRSRSASVDQFSPLQLRIYEPDAMGNVGGGPPMLRTLMMQVTGAQVDVTHTDWIDDAQFTRTYSLFAGAPIRRLRCQSNLTSWVAKIHTNGQTAQVNVAALDGASDGITDYFAFQTFAIAATRSASVFTGSGVLLQAAITAKALTTNVYPMCLDLASSTPPTTGVTTPIPGSVGAILTAAGVQDNYTDANSQGIVSFVNGLWFALSTTPDVWTDPGVGNTAVGSATVGV